ncbi:MAG TPA: alpha/beta fold hydrolase [Noviherbaspirillum sp.]
MKRIALPLAALMAVAATAYYSLPALFKEPLVQLNRTIAGLTEKSVRIDGHEVHYLEGGKGETVVLLHGIFAEKDHWVDFARPLADAYRIVAPDLPGFGESSRLDGHSYDYAAQTERLKELLDAVGAKRVHLAGNSMGGTIAALFAIRYPERVASVAFIGAPHGIRSPKPSEADRLIDAGRLPLIARDEAEFEQMLGRVFARRPFLPYPILHAARSGAVQRAESNVRLWNAQLKDRFLLHEQIAGLRVRSMALWGREDRIFDVSGATVLQAQLVDGEVQIMPDVGHLPMMEAPADAAGRYARFLAGRVQMGWNRAPRTIDAPPQQPAYTVAMPPSTSRFSPST